MRQRGCKRDHQNTAAPAVGWASSWCSGTARRSARRNHSHRQAQLAASNSRNRRSGAAAAICRNRAGLAGRSCGCKLVWVLSGALRSPARLNRPCIAFVGPAVLPPSAPCSSSWRRRRQPTASAAWTSPARRPGARSAAGWNPHSSVPMPVVCSKQLQTILASTPLRSARSSASAADEAADAFAAAPELRAYGHDARVFDLAFHPASPDLLVSASGGCWRGGALLRCVCQVGQQPGAGAASSLPPTERVSSMPPPRRRLQRGRVATTAGRRRRRRAIHAGGRL